MIDGVGCQDYFLDAPAHLEVIGVGDLVKVAIRAIPASDRWGHERVWVKVLMGTPDWLECSLESEPCDMPRLPKGASIRLPRSHVMDIVFESEEKVAALPVHVRREFWERCFVDQRVLDGELPVHFVYREEPDPAEGDDKYPDSGWRIRGDMRGVSDEQLAERKVAYVALGAVLNRDDSWIDLIDEPIGAAFEKDFDSGIFVRSNC